jgi:hypothetical protein
MIRVTREIHEVPVLVQERVTRAGGTNLFGEPNFRVVWGWKRLGWIGGLWQDRDPSGNLVRRVAELRLEPKYVPVDRWHVERWMPAESYGSPRAWYRQTIELANGMSIPALGPYPQRGDYEHCFTLTGPGGEFISLTPSAVEYVVRAITWAKQQPASIAHHYVKENWKRRDRAWQLTADAVLEFQGTD